MTYDNKKVRELSLDELDKVSGGTDFDIGPTGAGETICFQCSCGTVFNVKLGEKSAKCPNPNCGRIHTFHG